MKSGLASLSETRSAKGLSAEAKINRSLAMNFSLLDAELSRLLEQNDVVTEDDIKEAALGCCEQDEDREYLEAEGVYQFLVDQLGEPDMLLDFNWIAWGSPTSSSDWLYLMTLGTHWYLFLPPDTLEGVHPMVILGSVSANAPRSACARLVTKHLPTLFLDDAFGSHRLPTSTGNVRADLVPRQAVKNAYESVAQRPEVWGSLVDELREIVDINHLALEIPDGHDFDEKTRTRLFNEWFALTYSESK
jgi:hypothetical protein